MRHLFSTNIILLVFGVLPRHADALLSIGSRSPTSTCLLRSNNPITAAAAYRGTLEFRRGIQLTRRQGTKENGKDPDLDELEVVYIDTSQEDLPEDVQAELISNQPSEWAIMKELLGVNIFTYILGAAIAFFLGMNALLGPGWLGSTIGIPGTGTFTEQSDLIPDTFDLSKSEYLF